MKSNLGIYDGILRKNIYLNFMESMLSNNGYFKIGGCILKFHIPSQMPVILLGGQVKLIGIFILSGDT